MGISCAFSNCKSQPSFVVRASISASFQGRYKGQLSSCFNPLKKDVHLSTVERHMKQLDLRTQTPWKGSGLGPLGSTRPGPLILPKVSSPASSTPAPESRIRMDCFLFSCLFLRLESTLDFCHKECTPGSYLGYDFDRCFCPVF